MQQAERVSQAPQQDVDLAKASTPIEQRPDPAPQSDVDDLWKTVRSSNPKGDDRDRDGRNWNDPTFVRDDRHDRDGDHHDWDHDWDHKVRQWDRNWVRYDDYYRPILCNPYHNPIRVVYIYDYRPRIVVVQPLASVVLGDLAYGAYNFTAFVADALGSAVDLAVGSFFGGGIFPGPLLAAPPPPPPLLTYDNVPVQVNYPQARYQPFVARQIVDVGDDAVYGEHKVLLDGVTPVWGDWTQGPDGQRLFEVHKTQQFPGLEDPQAGPLPGDYQLQLVDSPSGFTSRDVYLMVAGSIAATLALCALAGFFILRRRSRVLH